MTGRGTIGVTVCESSVWVVRGTQGVYVFVRVKKTAAALALGSFALAGAVSVAVTPAGSAGAADSSSTVTIADLCSCTGPEASSISQTSDTMQAWASWVNSHGGLAGHQVHLVILDDATARPRP